MDREGVIKVLKYYNKIDKEVQFNSRIINDLKDVYNKEDINDQVLKTINGLQNKNELLFKLKMEIIKELSILEVTQKTIIFEFYICEGKWATVIEKVNYCERQCRREKNKAIKKLGERFEGNKVISEHQYT